MRSPTRRRTNGFDLLPDGRTAAIRLLHGDVALIDVRDLARVLAVGAWRVGGGGYVVATVRRRTVYLHRIVLPDVPEADHRNHNLLDNRRVNLRPATRSTNTAHTRKRANCASRYKGVTWHQRIGRWQASLRAQGRLIHGGYYDTEDDAARWYNLKARELFGEFATLNDVSYPFGGPRGDVSPPFEERH
jgi:hypothetical protein